MPGNTAATLLASSPDPVSTPPARATPMPTATAIQCPALPYRTLSPPAIASTPQNTHPSSWLHPRPTPPGTSDPPRRTATPAVPKAQPPRGSPRYVSLQQSPCGLPARGRARGDVRPAQSPPTAVP